MEPKRRSGGRALALLLLLALLPRLCVLLAPRADLFGHGEVDAGVKEPSVFVGEELSRGSIAVEFLRGPLLSPLDYQYAEFFGGSLVVSLLAAPVFAVFGPKIWALKAVPIAFHLAAVGLLFLLLDRFASRRAAWIGGLLLALSPPGYTLVTTVAWGSHMESNVLALLGSYLFLDLVAASSGRARRRFLLGLVMGFAIWFGYQCLTFIVAILVLDFLVDRRSFFRREILAQAAGIAAGFAPWIVYNLRYDFAGLSIYGSSLLDHVRPSAGHGGPFQRLAALFFEGLPASYFFKASLGLSPMAWGILGSMLLAAGVLAFAWSARSEIAALFARALRPIERPVPPSPGVLALAFLAVYVVVVATSDFRIPHAEPNIRQIRYVMLVFPFLFMATAVGVDRLASSSPAFARTSLGLIGVHCAISFLAVLPYCDASRFWADHAVSAAPDDGIGRWLAWRFGADPVRLERIVEQAGRKRTPEQQEALYASMGKFLRFMSDAGRKQTDWDRAHFEGYVRGLELLRARVPAPYRRHFESTAGS